MTMAPLSASLSASPSGSPASFATAISSAVPGYPFSTAVPASMPPSAAASTTSTASASPSVYADGGGSSGTGSATNTSTTASGTRPRAARTKSTPIADDKTRRATFLKRKQGLFKKAMELATLCQCEIAVVVFDHQDRLHHFTSTDHIDDLLLRFANHMRPPLDVKSAKDYAKTTIAASMRGNSSTGTPLALPEPALDPPAFLASAAGGDEEDDDMDGNDDVHLDAYARAALAAMPTAAGPLIPPPSPLALLGAKPPVPLGPPRTVPTRATGRTPRMRAANPPTTYRGTAAPASPAMPITSPMYPAQHAPLTAPSPMVLPAYAPSPYAHATARSMDMLSLASPQLAPAAVRGVRAARAAMATLVEEPHDPASKKRKLGDTLAVPSGDMMAAAVAAAGMHQYHGHQQQQWAPSPMFTPSLLAVTAAMTPAHVPMTPLGLVPEIMLTDASTPAMNPYDATAVAAMAAAGYFPDMSMMAAAAVAAATTAMSPMAMAATPGTGIFQPAPPPQHNAQDAVMADLNLAAWSAATAAATPRAVPTVPSTLPPATKQLPSAFPEISLVEYQQQQQSQSQQMMMPLGNASVASLGGGAGGANDSTPLDGSGASAGGGAGGGAGIFDTAAAVLAASQQQQQQQQSAASQQQHNQQGGPPVDFSWSELFTFAAEGSMPPIGLDSDHAMGEEGDANANIPSLPSLAAMAAAHRAAESSNEEVGSL